MVSFDSFNEMYKFAREIDEGIKCLEDKLRHPAQLLYSDKKAVDEANLCVDNLGEEILSLQAEVKELIERETEELQLLTEERDDFAAFVKEMETGVGELKSILMPNGCKHGHHKENTPMSSSSSLVPLDHHMYTSQMVSDESGNYSTPDLFKRPLQLNGVPEFNCTVQEYSTTFHDGGRMKLKKENNIKTPKPNTALLSQMYVYTPEDSGLSSLSHLNTTYTDKRPLRNDIKTPKTNKPIYKLVQMTTPPDPGFSGITQQIYKLNIGRKE